MTGTLRGFAEALGVALLPLVEATEDAELGVDFLLRLGWETSAAPASFMAMNGVLSQAFENAVGGEDGLEVDLGVLIPSVLAAWGAIDALASAPDLSAEQRAELPRQIIDALLEELLQSHFPVWHAALDALGIVNVNVVAGVDGRRPYERRTLDRGRLLDYIDEPLESLKETYRWGEASFDGARVTRAVTALARACGAQIDRYVAPSALTDALGARASGPRIVLVDRRGSPLVVGLAFLQVPATPTALPGVAIIPTATAPVEHAIGLFDGRLVLDGDLAAGVGVALRAGQPPTAVAGAAFRIEYERRPPNATTLLGEEEGTRVELRGTTATLEVAGSDGGLMVTGTLLAHDFALVLDGGDGDGFMGALLPGPASRIDVPLSMSWSTHGGLRLGGSPILATNVPVARRLGAVEVTEASVALRKFPPSSGGPSLSLTAAMTCRGSLGPVSFSLAGAGLEMRLAFGTGNLGPLDVGVGFKPPTGLSLGLDAGPVQGGGYLRHEAGRYAGALALDVVGVAVGAYGLLDARGPGYSLAAVIAAGFRPVPLPLGFTLEGVGGLIGIHRRVDTEALRGAVRTAAGMAELFFPADPMAQAERLTTELGRYFPAAEGRHVFGPAVKFGWGNPTVVRGTVAVLLELPAPARVVVLGTMTAKLPTEEQAIVDLTMDVVGEVDVGQKRAAVDASLRSSTIAGFPITGDLAARLCWGNPRSFALAIGGFHSQFRPPAEFPTLRRVRIELGSGDDPRLDAEGFLALTSNTLQMGARIDLYASAGPLNITGGLGFETLVQFSPFGLAVDVWAGVKLRRGTTTLAGVSFEGHLQGPKPWRIDGKACLSLWFVELCVPIHVTFGSGAPVAVPDRAIWPALRAAVEAPAAWAAEVPGGLTAAIVAGPEEGAGVAGPARRVDPCATLSMTQQVVPLARRITAYAQGRPTGIDRFEVTEVRVGGQAVPAAAVTPVKDWFAPAQFEAMSEADKLSRPGFEEMMAGVAVGAATVRAGTPLTRVLDYDTVVIAGGQRQTAERYRPTRALQLAGTALSATAQAPRGRGGSEAYAPPPGAAPVVTLTEATYVIATTDALTARWDLTEAASRSEAELALRAHLAAHPGDATRLQVVPSYEVAA